MLLKWEDSLVILVDVQEKLTPAIYNHEHIIANQKWILELANELAVPVLVSEQYPQGLGKTISELALIAKQNVFYNEFDKCDFSCAGASLLKETLSVQKHQQIILIGIEAHVCVLQTAIELRDQGYAVFVVADAVGSRSEFDKEIAFLRLIPHGIQVITKEMLFFEWIRTSQHQKFRELSKRFMQGK